MNIAGLEASLGIEFEDKSLLQRALTHRSYLNENPNLPWLDNERLEFLGDSILGFVTAEYLYHRFPEMSEGDLTSLRAALVRGQTLAEYAAALELGPYLLVSRGEEAAGGRARRALLAGTFEAVIGAIYLDRGLDAARHFVLRMIEQKTPEIVSERLDRNAKSLLQELSQGRLKLTPTYRTILARGPDHAREFTVQVLLGDRVYGVGQGSNKQTAEQEAARAAIQELERQTQHELEETLARQENLNLLREETGDSLHHQDPGGIDTSETPAESANSSPRDYGEEGTPAEVPPAEDDDSAQTPTG
ncbi:MAG: ribonuclease III [Rudaea sp.]